MLAVIAPEQFEPANLLFSPRSDNNVVRGTFFYRIQYAHSASTLAGVFILFSLRGGRRDTAAFGKETVDFPLSDNVETVTVIKQLERSVIASLDLKTTVPVLGIATALDSQTLRSVVCSTDMPKSVNYLVLRISGVWEDATNHGLVYRFMIPSRPL
jgi:hypothetical protein